MALEPDASLERQMGMRPSVVLLALAVAGCASGSHASGEAPSAAARNSPAQVSVQVSVPSRTMEAGSSMLAHIIIDNRTGHAIHAPGCGQLFELALDTSSHPALASRWPACLQILTIPIGKSSYPQTITATYDECGGTTSLPADYHACLPGGRPPPLPAGEYRVVFFESSNIVSVPAPIPVRVTPRSLLASPPSSPPGSCLTPRSTTCGIPSQVPFCRRRADLRGFSLAGTQVDHDHGGPLRPPVPEASGRARNALDQAFTRARVCPESARLRSRQAAGPYVMPRALA
jgi:hypothetical protein